MLNRQDYFKHLMKYPLSRKSRKFVREYRKNKRLSIFLVMTLVVKDEEKIIEKQIRFHKAMGVDAFIVTSHNSTDKTNEILEKLKADGLIVEILYKHTQAHQHHIWVNDMVDIAQKKYKADWVINADADEFYYSKSLNLKADIADAIKAGLNNLWVDSTFLFPTNEEDYLRDSHYFVIKPFQKFEAQNLGIEKNENFEIFIGSQECTKVIHNTKDFESITDGNHSVKMRNQRQFLASNIVLYHYHIRNYKGYEEKVKRWLNSAHCMPEGQGEHMKAMINLYKQGKLMEHYEAQFGVAMKEFLLKEGVIAIDKSVPNFLKWKGIIK